MDHPADPRRGAEPPGPDTPTVRLPWLQQGPSADSGESTIHPSDAPETGSGLASRLFQDFRRLHSTPSESDDESSRQHAVPRDSVADLLRQNAVLRSLGGASGSSEGRIGLPAIGDDLFGFRLRNELGRGAFARVFLAEQAGLAGRPVVLKVSGIVGDEPQTLAQLQHTNIVPIYSVHEDTQSGLRAVCMPYFGGASLSQILHAVYAASERPAQAEELVHALATVGSGQWAVGSKDTGAALLPTAHCLLPTIYGSTYLRAAVWIVARLAEALQHAHQRGVLHRDIKPSNVLLGGDGQPMLLDFNLAQVVNGPHAQASATLGGTVAYMAPEHLRALASRDPSLARLVDHRADLYALGMVLYEMLTGHRPFEQSASYAPLPALIEAMAVERSKAAPSLRHGRPDVPWSLESIARQCLAPDATRRYQRAEDLAEDLQRFLEDRPLRYAPELSRIERARKWMRRHPRLTTSGSVSGVAALVLTTLGTAYLGVQENLASTRQNLVDSQEHLDFAQTKERKKAFEQGTQQTLCLLNTTTDLSGYLAGGLAVCEQTLGLFGVLEHEDWQDRPEWRRLKGPDQARFAEDTRELLLLLASGRTRGKPGDLDALREALGLVGRAEAIRGPGPSRALYEDRAHYLTMLSDHAGARAALGQADQLHLTGFRDHYQLAQACARLGTRTSRARAIKELDEAIRLEPHHYWSWMQRGICHQDQGEVVLAAGDFGVCVGLWPEFAWGHYNRGYVLDQAGKKEDAVKDFTAALERDPRLVPAYLSRGLARVGLRQYEAALADFDAAAKLGEDDIHFHLGRGQALEALGRGGDADAAFEQALRLARKHPNVVVRTWALWVYGNTVALRLPEQARQAFNEVLRLDPGHAQALYGLALLATRRADVLQALPIDNRELTLLLYREEAIRWFNLALQSDPNLADARRFRAVLLARSGWIDLAFQDISWCLDKEPSSGPSTYAAACILSLQSARNPEPLARLTAATQALQLLEKAFDLGYGRAQAGTDPDLAAIREMPEFRKLLN